MPGPPPKRSSQRRRRNKPDVPIESAAGSAVVPVPTANSKWHPVAKRWFNSLAKSGQSQFYEPSDWVTAEVLAESISRELREDGPVRASALQAFFSGMTSLLVTEGDRRRARLELERPKSEPEEDTADVSELDEYRRRARSG